MRSKRTRKRRRWWWNRSNPRLHMNWKPRSAFVVTGATISGPPFCHYVCLSPSLSDPLPLSLILPLCLSFSLRLSHSLSLAVALVCLWAGLLLCLSICLFLCLSVSLPMSTSVSHNALVVVRGSCVDHAMFAAVHRVISFEWLIHWLKLLPTWPPFKHLVYWLAALLLLLCLLFILFIILFFVIPLLFASLIELL